MSKKTKKLFYLSAGYVLLILFLQTIYRFFYYSIPQSTNPSAAYFQIEAFMSPIGLTFFMSIIFIVAIVITALFESY